MDYTTEMYEEDKKISLSVFKKKIKGIGLFARYKDDLIQVSLIALFRARQLHNETKGDYFKYAFSASYYAMLLFIKRERIHTNDFNTLSLDFEYQDDDPLEYFIGEEYDFDKNLRYEQLLSVCNKVIDKRRSKNFKHIAKEFIQGKTSAQIAKDMGVSRQCANEQVNIFKRLVKEKLLKMGYER